MKIKNTVDIWFEETAKTFLEYFNQDFQRNTLGVFKAPSTIVRNFINPDGKTVDMEKLSKVIAQIYIDGIVKMKKAKLTVIPFKLLLPETRELLREAVCEAVQHAVLNKQVWERLNASSVSTPNFSMNTDSAGWLLSMDLFGKFALNLVEQADLEHYNIVGDGFQGMYNYSSALSEVVLFQWNNEYYGKNLSEENGTFDTIQGAIASLVGIVNSPDLPYDKFDWVKITNELGTEQVWRFEGGDFTDEANWDRKDIKIVDGNRYLVYKNFILAGARGADGKPGEPGQGANTILGGSYDSVNKELVLTMNDGNKLRIPMDLKVEQNIKTVDTYAGVDTTKINTLFIVTDMDGITADAGYKFKAGEPGTVMIDKYGTIIVQPLPDMIWKSLEGSIKKVSDNLDSVDKGVKDNTEKIEMNGALIQINADEILKKVDLFDYSGLTTQKELYDKVLADGIIPGSSIKLKVGGVVFVARAVGLDEIKKEFVYEIEGDWLTADGDHITSFRKATADGTSGLLIATPTASLIQAQQFKAKEPATKEKHLVRFKEFSPVKDMAIINKVAISVMQGRTFTITGSSFIKALARLADFLQTPVPAPYTDWVTAIATEVGFDSLFDDKYQWLTTPQAQWAKVNLYEATPSGTTDQPVRFNLSFRGYLADGTLSTNHDQLSASAVAQVGKKSLMKEFLALTLYKEADTMKSLQTVLDNIAGIATDAGFQIDNIIKHAGVNAAAKFGDGVAVNQQAGAGYSKAEIDKLTANTELDNVQSLVNAGKIFSFDPITGKAKYLDNNFAILDLSNVEDTANKGKMLILNKVTGKAEWIDFIADNNQALKAKAAVDLANVEDIAHKGKFPQLDKTTGKLIWVDLPSPDDKQNVPTNDATGTSGYVQTYVSPGVSKWEKAKGSTAPGTQTYKLLVDSAKYKTSQAWTDPATGIKGYWRAIVSDDNYYYVDGNTPHTITSPLQIGSTAVPYSIWAGHMPKYKDVKTILMEIPASAITNPHIRVNLLMATAYRSVNSKILDADAIILMNEIIDNFYAPTPAKVAALVAKGMIASQLKQTAWSDVPIDTATLSGVPTLIAATKATHNYTLLQHMRLWAMKGSDGKVTIFLQDPDAYDPQGEDGPVFIPLEMSLEVANSADGAGAGTTGGVISKQLTTISQKVTSGAVKLGKLELQVAKNNLDLTNNINKRLVGPVVPGTEGQHIVSRSGKAVWEDMPATSIYDDTDIKSRLKAIEDDYETKTVGDTHETKTNALTTQHLLEAKDRNFQHAIDLLTSEIAKLKGSTAFDPVEYKKIYTLPNAVAQTPASGGHNLVAHSVAAKSSQDTAAVDYTNAKTKVDIDAAIKKMNDANNLMSIANGEQVTANGGGGTTTFNPATYKASHTLAAKTGATAPTGTANAVPEIAIAKGKQDAASTAYGIATTQSQIDAAIADMIQANKEMVSANVKQDAANIGSVTTGRPTFVGTFADRTTQTHGHTPTLPYPATAAEVQQEFENIGKDILPYQFADCGLTSISLPTTTRIGTSAFGVSTSSSGRKFLSNVWIPNLDNLYTAAIWLGSTFTVFIPRVNTLQNNSLLLNKSITSGTITMPAKFNTKVEKDRIFGTNPWNTVVFKFINPDNSVTIGSGDPFVQTGTGTFDPATDTIT